MSLETQVGLRNGSGAAAILAAGVGCFAIGLIAVIADKMPSVKRALVFYKPTGALSGVTTAAILILLVSWAVLEWRWKSKSVALARINIAAIALLAIGLLLTFPPVGDMF